MLYGWDRSSTILLLDYQLESLYLWGRRASYLILSLEIYRSLLSFYSFSTMLWQYHYLSLIYLSYQKLCSLKQKVYYHLRNYGLRKTQWIKRSFFLWSQIEVDQLLNLVAHLKWYFQSSYRCCLYWYIVFDSLNRRKLISRLCYLSRKPLIWQ